MARNSRQLAAFALLLTAAHAPARADEVPVTLPFELVNRHVVLKVRVNDSRPLSFLLDTGDKYAVMDMGRAKELGVKLGQEVHVDGAGSKVKLGALTQGAMFTVEGLENFTQPVFLAMPLDDLAPRLGSDFDGILGADFIRNFVVEVDYEARVLRLHHLDAFTYAGPGESIPIELDALDHPTIRASVTPLGGVPIPGTFRLDLGSGASCTLSSPFVREHHLPGAGAKTVRSIGHMGAGGRTNAEIGRMARLSFGGFQIPNPQAEFSRDSSGAFASTEVQGNIGEQVLSKFRLFLDYPHKRIIFEPNRHFTDEIAPAISGVVWEARGAKYDTLRVVELLEHSPGTEAGLKPGDTLAKVGGRDAGEISLSELLVMLEKPAALALELVRDGKPFLATLVPRKMF